MGNWFRDDLKDFKNYKADEHREGIFLNANESFIDLGSQFQSQIFDIINKMAFNRYPSSMGEELLKSYSS
ncbi:MAG: hypothetical protein N2Z57_08965, partial [Oscillospiraceae bacterium]|nr:hypothetical protein [Oscillospiraceae bacterium]